MARANPTIQLAARLVEQLRLWRETEFYPPTLRQLAQQAAPEASEIEILKAASGKTPFAVGAVLLHAKNIDSPVVLQEDEDRLLHDARSLLFLLEQAATATAPAIEAKKIAAKATKNLRGPFEKALRFRIENDDLPAGVALVRAGRKELLHLTRLPLPRAPEELLAERLIERLRDLKGQGGAAYPPTLSQLQAAANEAASAAQWKKALAASAVKKQVVFSAKPAPGALLALNEDADRLAASDQLLVQTVYQCRLSGHQVLSIADLKKKVARPLQPGFQAALLGRRETGRLPAGLGMLMQKRQPVFFLLEDLAAGSSIKLTPTSDDGTFAERFDQAFNDLDRARGGHNFVSLLELRARLPQDAGAFNEGLQQFRRQGRYTLSAAEGRHGLTPEELAAAISEEGALLLYVSRRRNG